MCQACEEQDQFYRQYFGAMLARGIMPEGIDPADLEALGLDIPPELKYALGANTPAKAAAQRPSPDSATPTNTFDCDSPDQE